MRILKDGKSAVAAGLAKYDDGLPPPRARDKEPAAPQDIAHAMATMQEAIVAKLSEMGHEQLRAVMDSVEKVSLQSELVAKILVGGREGKDRWTFHVTERDTDGRIKTIEGERE